MNIYFISIEEIINKFGRDYLRKLYGNYHHYFSRIFLKKILSEFYNINAEISDDNGRPYIKEYSLNFSISHSKNIVAIAFNDNNGSKIGFDIEYIKPRNYNAVLNYYGVDKPDVTQDEFFQIWTAYEAEYKSGAGVNKEVKYDVIKNNERYSDSFYLLSFKYKNYMAALSTQVNSEPNLYEIILSDIEDDFILKEITRVNYLEPSKVKLK